MTFYEGLTTSEFYGSGIFYGGPAATSAGMPQSLRFYRTSQDGIYVFYWTFPPNFITPSLSSFDFQLELDTTPLFNSPNLVSFTSTSAIDFQNGNVWKGFSVPVAARLNDITQTWYARVRSVSGSFVSDWSATLTWTIPQSWQQQVAEDLMKTLPDAHVYGKGDLLLPVDERNTNLWVVENMYGNQFDKAYYENFLTQTDNFISLCRDEFLYQNFGVLFNFPKSNLQQFVEYRETLRQLILGSLNGSTVSPIYNVIQTFTGVPPAIQNIRDLNDFFLNYIEEIPLNWANQLINPSFELWNNGTLFTIGAAGFQITEGWSYSPDIGTPIGTISQDSTTVTDGSFSLRYSQTNATASGIVLQGLDVTKYKGKTLTLSVDVKTASLNVAIAINDGGVTYSSVHPADGNWHTLTVSKIISNTAPFVAIYSLIQTVVGAVTANIDNAILRVDGVPDVTTNFLVSYEFVPGSMNVFKNYTRLTPGVDFTEDEALPGFILSTPPASTDALLAFYKIGAPTDPTPVLFSPPLNLVKNGNFTAWSNGNFFTNPTNTLGVADHWTLGVIGTPISTVSQETSNVDIGTTTAAKIVITDNTGNSLWDMYQIIPSFMSLRGRTVTVSARIQASANGATFYLYDGFSLPSVAVTTSGGYTTYTLSMVVASNATTFQVGFGTPNGQIPNGTWYIDNIVALDQTDSRFISGFTTFTNGSAIVTGIGSSFTTDLTANTIIADADGYYATVGTVNSSTSLLLINPWGGPTETVPGVKAVYDIPPLVLWDSGTLAFGVVISIPNPGQFILDLSLIESLVNPLLPASTKVFYQIVS